MAVIATDHAVFLSVGSYLGDKLENCLKGISALSESGDSTLIAASRFFRTSPVDYTQQDLSLIHI